MPSGPSGSTIAGILLFGLIARNSGSNCSPVPMSIGMRAIGQAALLQHDVDLVAIGRGPRIHFDHRSGPRAGSPRPASDCNGSGDSHARGAQELVRQGLPRQDAQGEASRPGPARVRLYLERERTATASPSTAASTRRPGASSGAGRSGPTSPATNCACAIALGLPPDLQMLLMTRSLKETLENAAFEHAVQSACGRRIGTDRRGRDALAGAVPEDLVRRVEDPAQHLRRRVEPGARGPAWLEGPLGARASSARPRPGSPREPPFLLMTCAAASTCARRSRRPTRGRRRRGGRPVPDRGRSAPWRVGRTRGDEPVRWTESNSTAWTARPPERPR